MQHDPSFKMTLHDGEIRPRIGPLGFLCYVAPKPLHNPTLNGVEADRFTNDGSKQPGLRLWTQGLLIRVKGYCGCFQKIRGFFWESCLWKAPCRIKDLGFQRLKDR